MTYPSVKTLEQISRLTPESARKLRKLLEVQTVTELEKLRESGDFPVTQSWVRSCYHQPHV